MSWFGQDWAATNQWGGAPRGAPTTSLHNTRRKDVRTTHVPESGSDRDSRISTQGFIHRSCTITRRQCNRISRYVSHVWRRPAGPSSLYTCFRSLNGLLLCSHWSNAAYYVRTVHLEHHGELCNGRLHAEVFESISTMPSGVVAISFFYINEQYATNMILMWEYFVSPTMQCQKVSRPHVRI
jgi:hypothetical protein